VKLLCALAPQASDNAQTAATKSEMK